MNYNRELLFGNWFRSESDGNGDVTTESALISPDGSYEFSFTVHDKSGTLIQESIELGDWGLVGNIHFTMAKSEYINQQNYAADLADADNYHAYKVIQLNSQFFEYQHVITNEVFILRRVVDKIGHC